MRPTVLAISAALGGFLLGPPLRARIFHHTIAVGTRWRTDCPHCGRSLVGSGWRGLADWLPPHGRCPRCASRIGPRPGLVEGLTAAVLALLAWRIDGPLPLAALCWVAAVGVALAFVDVAVRRLPDQLTLAALGGALALAAVEAPGLLPPAVLGALGLGGGYLLLATVNPKGMGLGDVKLALALGAALGPLGLGGTVTAGAAAFALAGGFSLALLMLGRATRHTPIPHGPFLLAGALLSVLLTKR